MNGLSDFYVWRQRREELLKEAQMNRLAKALRPHRSRRRPLPILLWELKRYGGRLSKLLRDLRQHPRKETNHD
ncbi:hypothetical protein BH24ACT22_BH24ACT22_13150 [soil metagenome]